MKVSTSWEGPLPLSSHFEMYLQKGSIFYISQQLFLWSSMKGGGALTLSVYDVDLTISVLLQVWVAGPSRVDVTTMLMEALEVTGVSLTSTNCERQSAALLQAPDIHSKVMSHVLSSSGHLFTFLFAFVLFRNFCKGLWSLHTTVSDPYRSV